jgi:MerR family transcriptional regulator, redox-sensitive transcriptional activator SoxR
MDGDFSIGQVSQRSGVSVPALRFYEERGLIHAERTEGKQRRFRRDVLRRLAFIQAAQRVGLTLEEIGAALATLPRDVAPTKADWTRISQAWRPMLDQRIHELQVLRGQLDSCIGCGCLSLDRCRLRNPGDRAGELGPGPRYLLGDDPQHAPRSLPATKATITP